MNHKPSSKGTLKEIGLFFGAILWNALIIIALIFLVRSFLFSPFKVIGSSMADTLESQEFILIDKLSYLVGDIDRGDPIVFLPPPSSSDAPKFETSIKTDADGYAKLNLTQLQGESTSHYCQNEISNHLWLCKTHPEERDLVYFSPQEQDFNDISEINGENAESSVLSKENVEEGYFELKGNPETSYSLKIYDSHGPEYYVKRVIGIPGDTVKIVEGKVYLKSQNDEEFQEIDESFSNYQKTLVNKSEAEKIFVVPEGNYFVMGDNRGASTDSRAWLEPVTLEPHPFVPEENITGKVFVVLWPFTKIQWIESAEL